MHGFLLDWLIDMNYSYKYDYTHTLTFINLSKRLLYSLTCKIYNFLKENIIYLHVIFQNDLVLVLFLTSIISTETNTQYCYSLWQFNNKVIYKICNLNGSKQLNSDVTPYNWRIKLTIKNTPSSNQTRYEIAYF